MRDVFTSVYIINNDIEALSFIEMRGKIDSHSRGGSGYHVLQLSNKETTPSKANDPA